MFENMVKDIAESVKKSVKTAIDVFAGEIEPRLAEIHKATAEQKVLFELALAEIRAELDERIKSLPIQPVIDESKLVKKAQDALAFMVKDAVSAIEIPKAKHGRDALDMEILPEIDETESYQRGQYATHRGGLWKSYKKTHGMNGWECITDGIFKTVVNKVDDRNFCFVVEKASGAITKLPFEVESTSYKKIYIDGKEYQKGDFVTWAGSLWHCNEKTSDKPGDGSNSWTLAVKKGRDYSQKVKV